MSLGKKVVLNTGHELPQLGFGTWQSAPGLVSGAVFEALKAGYRHLDLAMIYENQTEVAVGLKKAFSEIPNLKREDVFITSKLWNTQHRPEVVEAALDSCLKELQLDYLDLYLVHWPVAFEKGDSLFPLVEDGDISIDDGVSIVDTWKAMTKLPKSKARSVGVSNHTVEHLETIIKATGDVPAVNQVERHPLLQSKDLVAYCKEKGIHITAYSAFGNNGFGEPLIITRPEVLAVAGRLTQKSGKPVSGAQVLLAWARVGGHSVIPKSITTSRIQENFQDIELSTKDIADIDVIGEAPRRYNIPLIANTPRWNVDIFGDESEKPAKHRVILHV